MFEMDPTEPHMKFSKTDDLKPVDQLPPVRWWHRLIRILAAVLLIFAGVAGAGYLKKTAPKSKKRPPAKMVPVVHVKALKPARHRVVLTAMGTVIPARQVELKSRVAGQIITVHPEFSEGGFLKTGDRIIQLDDADYRLVLAQRKSDLINSQHALKLELGRQEVARREWKLLGGKNEGAAADNGAPLALRGTYLEKAQADVASAKAAVEKAALDLERARILAPFNAIVRSKSVDVGSQVSAQEPLAELVGTDVYWVQASVPVDRLAWIQIPQKTGTSGSPAKIHYASGHRIDGTVKRLMGDLTQEGRMARILIEVRDPLHLKVEGHDTPPPLLIGEYVRVEIQGRQLDGVFTVPRTALRDNQTVWLMNSDRQLEIHKVTPLWRDAETVVLKNDLKPGDQLIISDLPAPVPGMPLRPADDSISVGSGGPQKKQSEKAPDHHG